MNPQDVAPKQEDETKLPDAEGNPPAEEGDKTKITSSVIQVEILGFSDPFEGKIDTGAAQSSLHAEDIEVDGSTVVFVVGDRRYRTAVKSSQDISSSDGGTQSRPVIAVSLTISGQTVEVDINLNDRSGMPQPLLIGQDVIKAANLVIDISEEPSDSEAGIPTGADGTVEPKPEQEELPTGQAPRPEVSSQSIAQLGDNPLAHKDDAEALAKAGDEPTLLDVKTQLQDLLAKVEKLISKQG